LIGRKYKEKLEDYGEEHLASMTEEKREDYNRQK
jgi:hypothetical protein